MKAKRKMLPRYALLATAILVFLVALIFPGWARYTLKKDREEAPPQKGVATVEMLVPERMEVVTDKHYPARVFVRLGARTGWVRSVPDIQGLEIGKPARILYRIGKSGRFYVEYIQPMSAKDDLADEGETTP